MPRTADEAGVAEDDRPVLALAVIGHVNHGKTALVRALTGMQTDRLREEIERGLSITLGFAWRDYETTGVDLIDTPGHEDFIRAMAAGAAGARAALLVVSAVEGFGRQTREHLEIAGLLGVTAGVVAVTKGDLLPAEDEATVRALVAEELHGTFLEGAPVVICSATTGAGLEALHQQLEDLARRCPSASALAGAFLPIDRAFTITGAGAVVTGALLGGPLTTGGEAVVQPLGRKVGIRQVQVHGANVEAAQAGRRVAVNLRGVPAEDLKAGQALCTPGAFAASLQVDVEVTVTAGASRPLRHLDQLRVLWGARADVATVRLWGDKSILPGGRGLAQLRFAAPVVAFAGQRGVLRRPSPAETIGGAVVLDPAPPHVRGRAAERRLLLQAVAAQTVGGIAARLSARDAGMPSLAEVARLSRLSPGRARAALEADFDELDGARLVSRTAVAEVRQAYIELLAEAHRKSPARAAISVGALRAGLTRRAPADLIAHIERTLAAEGEICLDGGQVWLPGHDAFAAMSPDAVRRLRQIEDALRAGGLKPPDIASLAGPDERDLVQHLTDAGQAVLLRNVALRQTLLFHRESLRTALAILRDRYPPPSTFTTGEAREALETTRKFIVPVLEHFDVQGLTTRDGDVRRVTGAAAAPAVARLDSARR